MGKLTGRPNLKKILFVSLIENIAKRSCLIRKNPALPIIKKFNFNADTKLYINEKLTSMNEAISFNCKKLRRISNIIHSCYTREAILHMKHEESSKPFKILHIFKLHELFPDLIFVYNDKMDVNTTVLSSYRLITKFNIHKGYLVASCLSGPRA